MRCHVLGNGAADQRNLETAQIFSILEELEEWGKQLKAAPVTLRLTEDERTKLEEMAAGMTLSADIRACVFMQVDKRRKQRSGSAIANKRAAA